MATAADGRAAPAGELPALLSPPSASTPAHSALGVTIGGRGGARRGGPANAVGMGGGDRDRDAARAPRAASRGYVAASAAADRWPSRFRDLAAASRWRASDRARTFCFRLSNCARTSRCGGTPPLCRSGGDSDRDCGLSSYRRRDRGHRAAPSRAITGAHCSAASQSLAAAPPAVRACPVGVAARTPLLLTALPRRADIAGGGGKVGGAVTGGTAAPTKSPRLNRRASPSGCAAGVPPVSDRIRDAADGGVAVARRSSPVAAYDTLPSACNSGMGADNSAASDAGGGTPGGGAVAGAGRPPPPPPPALLSPSGPARILAIVAGTIKCGTPPRAA